MSKSKQLFKGIAIAKFHVFMSSTAFPTLLRLDPNARRCTTIKNIQTRVFFVQTEAMM